MTPSYHINRTRRYLKFAAGDTAIGDYDRAAKALSRAASHAATAVAVHWHHLTGTRRRLQFALNDQAHKGNIIYEEILARLAAEPDPPGTQIISIRSAPAPVPAAGPPF